MEKLKMQSLDVIGSNTQKIAELFPNCVTERLGKDGKPELSIDFEKLQAELSNEIISEGEERYQFTWPDKRAAVRLANTPTTMTLRPCREESIDFDNTQNLYIEGDNLDVLKVLRETYLGKVKMIYIDPPYNTGNDFVYYDEFDVNKNIEEERNGLWDEDGNQTMSKFERNTAANGRFHTDWLNMIYPRLKVAKDILADDGVIFISIDDNEVENLQKVCDEIFGEQNFLANLIWKSKSGGANDSKYFAIDHEYILCYARHSANVKQFLDRNATITTSYNLSDEKGEYSLDRLDKQSLGYIESLDFPIIGPDGKEYVVEHKNPNVKVARWRWSKETVAARYDELVFKNGYVYTKNYKKESNIARSLLMEDRYGRTRTGKTDFTAMFDAAYFSAPKPEKLVYYFADIIQDKQALILDFFSGSATTAHAVMKLNAEDGGSRKFIMVQLPEKTDEKSEAYKAGYENICEIGKERIRRAGAQIMNSELGIKNKSLDTGFRVLKLDTSNMEDVYYTPKEFSMGSLFNENVKQDRTNEDLLFQVMLDLGIELSAKIESRQMAGKTVLFVDENYLIACFDSDVNETAITEIAKLQPIYFVMRDASAANDNVIDNFEQIFKHYSPETVCRII